MKLDGGCHCGTIRYTARIDPDTVVICHCTDCQTISGAPYRANVPVTQRAQLIPKSQGLCRSAMPWAMDISGIPKIPDPARR